MVKITVFILFCISILNLLKILNKEASFITSIETLINDVLWVKDNILNSNISLILSILSINNLQCLKLLKSAFK